MTSSKEEGLFVRLTGVVLVLAGCAGTAPGPVAPCIVPVDEPRVCTMDYVPVCGCDGRTYGNACAARAAGVQEFRPGECGTGAVDPIR